MQLRAGYTDGIGDHTVTPSARTSATAHDGPSEPCIWYGYVYRAWITRSPARASASATSLESTATWSRDGCRRRKSKNVSRGGSAGPGFQRAFSCSAATIAANWVRATTPTKLSRTTRSTKPGTRRTDDASPPASVAPMSGGRTTRPCSIPGTRTWWTYSKPPVTRATRSSDVTGWPRRGHADGGWRFAVSRSGSSNRRPPTSSPYVTRAPPGPEIAPSAIASRATGTLSRLLAISSNTSRAVAAASARFSVLKLTGVDWLPDVVPWSGVTAVSHSIRRSEERRVGKECRSRWWPYP